MKHLTLFIMLIIAPFTFADNSGIEKEDIKELVIMKDDKLFFYLDDGSIYKGDPKNPKHCPARVRGRVALKDTVHGELQILNNRGFTTCRFDLTRVA